MKIAYVGNFLLDYCTEVHIAKTLEKLGHEVTRIQENENNGKNLLFLVKDHDMFLFTRTWSNCVTLEHLAEMKKMGIPTVSYHLDLYVGLSRQNGIENDPFWRTEYVFSADGDPESQKFFESKGINHHWLLPAVYEDECVMFTPNNDGSLSGDVIFVGGGAEYGHPEWPYRHQLVKWLAETYGERYRKYGHPQRTVRGADLNQLYANSKIAIGDSVNIGFKHKNYTSDRLFESIGRGAFTIYPRIEGVSDLFPEHLQEIFYEYGDFEGLQKKIDYFLSNDDVRTRLRQEAFEFVKSSQTYTQRLQQLLEVIFGERAVQQKKTLKMPRISRNADVKINLGAGTDIQPGWVNVDMVDLPGIDKVHNLIKFPWPFKNGVASEIRAIDVLEHLPPYIGDKHGVIMFIEECHRILKPGGQLYIQTPGWRADFLWKDPTHVRGFDIESMDFFDPTTHFGTTTGFYSDCKFSVRKEELPNHNLRFWMTKI